MLKGSIDAALSSKPGGCLLILGVINCRPENQPARDGLLTARRATRSLIAERLQRGVDAGDLSPGIDVAQAAAFYHGIMQAISFQARDGASREQLEALVEPALAALN